MDERYQRDEAKCILLGEIRYRDMDPLSKLYHIKCVTIVVYYSEKLTNYIMKSLSPGDRDTRGGVPFFGKKVECLRRLLPPSTHSSSAAFITPPRGRSRHLRRPAITSLSTPESSRMRGDVRRVSAFSFFYRPTARPRRTSPPSSATTLRFISLAPLVSKPSTLNPSTVNPQPYTPYIYIYMYIDT